MVAESWVGEDGLAVKGHLGIWVGGDRAVLYLDHSGSYSTVSTCQNSNYTFKSEFYSL